MQAQKDYFKALDLSPEATEDDIRKAYRSLARQYHPDVNQSVEAVSLFQEIQEAYDVLSDPAQREAYQKLRESLGYSNNSALEIKPVLSHPQLSLDANEQLLYVLLDIKPATDLPTSRLPINLSIVLDRSTSMQGVRLKQVKQATYDIVERLQPEDSLSLVVFSDRAQVLLPSQKHIDKAAVRSLISTIQPGGGTELFQGLNAGLNELNRQRTQTSVNHLVLLTDGQTYGDEEACLDRSQWAGHNQISLSTMGLGADWNESLLDRMAAVSGGTSTYIDTPRKVVDAFMSTIESLTAIVARELNLQVNTVAGVSLVESFQSIPQINRLTLEGNQLSLGPLGRIQGKQVLLELRVQRQNKPGPINLARFRVSGDIPHTSKRRNWEMVDIQAEFVEPGRREITIPRTMITTLRRLTLFRVQEKAMHDVEQGDVQTATRRLSNLATQLLGMGEQNLARVAYLEAGRVAKTGHLSAEGRKQIHYGTRNLSLNPEGEEA